MKQKCSHRALIGMDINHDGTIIRRKCAKCKKIVRIINDKAILETLNNQKGFS
jgi:hypothetical protein